MRLSQIIAAASVVVAACLPAKADKLDDIIASGELRCAVILDFPPMGSRDSNNNPVGFDVDYCNDLAAVLGVKAVVVDTPTPDRIPALVSGRADVGVASVSDTLERAKTIGMTIPYFVFTNVVLTRKDAGIDTVADIKGHAVGGADGAYETIALERMVKELNDPNGSFRGFQNQSDVFLALTSKQIDATWVTSTVAAAIIGSGKYPGLKVAGDAPLDADFVSLIALREEQGLINFLNLFINRQVRSGRYAELYKKWIGDSAGKPPLLTYPGVYR